MAKEYRRLPPDLWPTIRSEWERTGATERELGEKYGVSHVTINKRRRAEEWRRDPTREVERRTTMIVAQRTAEERRAKVNKKVNNSPEVNSDEVNSSELPPLPEVPLTDEQVIQFTAEERADVILRHQREWAEFHQKVEATAMRIFDEPDVRIKRTIFPDGKVVEEQIFDFSRIEWAKKLAEMRATRQKSERSAHNLDHNLSTATAENIRIRDELIKDTFASIREAARRARMTIDETAVDITPKEGKP